ncbi:integrase [Rhizobium sp. Leaf384]|uniref:tyrosine-type recombinase/integrase n=1 Tax=unclassified Rhizobium TaxID=2613769 RepID=UPI0007134771|nr:MULTISPECIES: tyrosine-type recombinase/integrase [unclassified Rhizobium]KQS76844.1 integrase [Rhizobium sp. Leaf384]KQS78115.1 integrase [Rhizobium sp. Leaf383]
MTDNEYPYVSGFTDRHGKKRWRYRRAGKTIALPGVPGDPEFEEAYSAAIEGRERRLATVVRLPGQALPGSFQSAWKKVQRGPDWLAFDPKTKAKNVSLAGQFLELPVAPSHPEVWGDMLVRDLKRRHVKEILAHYSETPHKAKHVLVAIRKMIAVALDEEWIETDPTWKLSYRPEYTGWRAWTAQERADFESRWPLGSTPRTVYGLALWLGNRRSDLAKLEWKSFDFRENTVTIAQTKGGKTLVLPITPMLREIVDPIERKSPFVIVTAYGDPFSEKSLTGRMADWTHSAGLPKGCTIHGLRKTLGKLLAETGATTRQLMETLGHDNIEHAELYSREAEQQRLARDAMSRLSRKYQTKKPVG